MKELHLILTIKVIPKFGVTEQEVVDYWLKNSIDDIIHDSYNDEDKHIGAINVTIKELRTV